MIQKCILLSLFPFYLLFAAPANSQEDLLRDCRESIANAFKERSVADRLYEGLKKENGTHNLLYGYRGAIEMSFGKHESSLIKKGRYFSSGREILEETIAKDPTNIELIFLRYTIQYNVPSILGYKGNLEEDRAKLEHAVKTRTDLAGLKNSIQEFLENNQAE